MHHDDGVVTRAIDMNINIADLNEVVSSEASGATRSDAAAVEGDGRRPAQCLIDDAVALGQTQQGIELFFRGVGVELDAQADVLEADRHRLVDTERAAEVDG